MNKDNLVKALKKYHLNGILKESVVTVKDSVLSTKRFKTETGIIGSIEYGDIDVEDCDLGIYYTDQFLKMLSILETDVKCKVLYSDTGDLVTSLSLEDKKGKAINFPTCDPSLVTTVYSKSPKISEFEIKVKLNQEIIGDILKAQGAIDSSAMTFLYKKGKVYLVFGYSKNNTNQISFEVECEESADIDTVSFDNDSVKNILQVNQDKFMNATMEVSSKGLLRIYFEDQDFKAEYFLMKLEIND